MTKNKMNLQLFAAPTNTIVTTDIAPAISIDHATNFTESLKELQKVLGIAEMKPLPAGNTVKIYKVTQENTPDQVGEGETVPYTKIKRVLARTITLDLQKFRKNTTAEAIQQSGKEIAVNETDKKLLSGIRKGIKNSFYTNLAAGTGEATGVGLQATLAKCWGEVAKFYDEEDLDATPIYFVASDDVADYLATATVSLQTAFGFKYIEDFLGLGTAIIVPSLEAGTVYATAKENLHGVYVPANNGDVPQMLGMNSDARGLGLIGLSHTVGDANFSINTNALCGVEFYAELLDGVVKGTITEPTATAEEAGA